MAAFDLLGDPLSSVTRSTKKTLFVFASLCCLVGYTGILPDEASVFGFKFPGLTQNAIEIALLTLLLYSYVSFLIHLTSDCFRYRIAYDRYSLSRSMDISNSMFPPDEEEEYRESEFRRETGYSEQNVPHRLTMTISIVKLAVDVVLPVVFGLGSAIYFCVSRLG